MNLFITLGPGLNMFVIQRDGKSAIRNDCLND